MSTNDTLRSSWQEYRETLHGQHAHETSGQSGAVRWRSTTLAETFFTEQALVDTPLKTEFHKHLPGILTGLGIIGTFSGLITGLIRFEVSGDAERIRASLNGLIQSVGYSFVVSAMAITLAMLFIWVEKSLLSACYRRVEGLCRIIDSLFDAGAGEEYLARLVASSEHSAAQIAEIRNSLAGELRQVLAGILTQHAKTSAVLNRRLLSGIGESIRPHMETIVRTMEQRVATTCRVRRLLRERVPGIVLRPDAGHCRQPVPRDDRHPEGYVQDHGIGRPAGGPVRGAPACRWERSRGGHGPADGPRHHLPGRAAEYHGQVHGRVRGADLPGRVGPRRMR